MQAKHYSSRPVITADRHETVSEVAKKMRDFHVGDVVIVESGKNGAVPVGIITDRDIVIEIVAKDLSPLGILAEEMMTEDLVSADEDMDADLVVSLMREHGIRRVPLVNKDRVLSGIVSLDDLIERDSRTLRELKYLPRTQRNWERVYRL